MNVVDSHAHVISPDRDRYPFRPGAEVGQLGSLTGKELAARMDEAGVAIALLVQRGQAYGLDNSYVVDCAAASAGRLVAVCAADARDERAAVLARKWHDRGAVGFRMMGLPMSSEIDWLSGSGAVPLWRMMSELDLPLCVHFFPSNRTVGIAALVSLMEQFPSVRVVIDHLANGVQAQPFSDGIDPALRSLVEREQAILKFTAIPLAGLGEDAGKLLRRYADLFGPDRMMWGSDVTQSNGTYRELVELANRALEEFSPRDRATMLGETAGRVYGLDAITQPAR